MVQEPDVHSESWLASSSSSGSEGEEGGSGDEGGEGGRPFGVAHFLVLEDGTWLCQEVGALVAG